MKLGLFILITTPIASIWEGYVISVLWRWFVVSTFHLPVLSIPAAIGLSLVTSLLTYQTIYQPENKGKGSEEAKHKLFVSIFIPTSLLVVGAIVNHWM